MAILIGLNIFATNLIGLIYMSVYSYVRDVGSLLNWTPVLLSLTADITLISTLFWHTLFKGRVQKFKLAMVFSWLFRLASVITLTALNKSNDAIISYEFLTFGSLTDITSMVKILEVTSTSINWLVLVVHLAVLLWYR